jgi:hypothetical protein
MVGCGPQTTPDYGSGDNWWDDLYLKETGDWLADDRADTGAIVTVGPAPLIGLSTNHISANARVCSNPANDTFSVYNAGVETLNYSITTDVGWLSVYPDAGTITDETNHIDVIYDTTALRAGPYSGSITITDEGSANSPQAITVSLTLDTVQADFDGDGDVDLEDFARFQSCTTGSGASQNDPACQNARFDLDDDVDRSDLSVFQGCVSGANVLADPGCGE